jgi:hypothetical protein
MGKERIIEPGQDLALSGLVAQDSLIAALRGNAEPRTARHRWSARSVTTTFRLHAYMLADDCS